MSVLRFIPAHAGNTSMISPPFRTVPVHPRACGEHMADTSLVILANGSSPRMRGTRGATASNRGKQPVHPRACGEHVSLRSVSVVSAGSSPRMRGTPLARRSSVACRRFIPAHAGNTLQTLETNVLLSVHPRACGEHHELFYQFVTLGGSSPRMRGTHLRTHDQGVRVRFIPAHAGNTRNSRKTGTSRSVHPRACGEHAR